MVLALLTAVITVGLGGTSSAESSLASPPRPVSPAAAQSADAIRAVTAFWTPQRMRLAKTIDQRVSPDALKPAPAGLPSVVAATAAISAGAPWTGGSISTTAGRVFFTYQGRTASCSGNAVTSANKSTVMTAGHCVKLTGAFHTNWVFAPAYNNGNTPYGVWTARLLRATPQWVASEDINYDVGAAVVNTLNGQSLTDVVGAQGIAFNQPRSVPSMHAFGYPAVPPYDGTRLIYCSGPTFPALLSNGLGLLCDMTGGASGGPWLLNFNAATGTGTQNSVNSYKINGISALMFGPYFGTDARNLYNSAQAA